MLASRAKRCAARACVDERKRERGAGSMGGETWAQWGVEHGAWSMAPWVDNWRGQKGSGAR